MTIIRDFKDEDMESVKRVGQRYSEETLLGSLTNEQLTAIAISCTKNGVTLVGEVDGKVVGLIAGQIIDGFSMGRFCEEVVWFVEPEHRGIGLMLFHRFQEICKEKGCVGVSMAAYNNKYLRLVDKLYIENGFKEIERKYYKSL